MLKAPCKDCPDRYLGCHDRCEKFEEYAKERERIRELRAKRFQTNYDCYKIRNQHVRKDTRK